MVLSEGGRSREECVPPLVQGASEMAEMEHVLNVYAAKAAKDAVADFLGFCEVYEEDTKANKRLTPGLWLVRCVCMYVGVVGGRGRRRGWEELYGLYFVTTRDGDQSGCMSVLLLLSAHIHARTRTCLLIHACKTTYALKTHRSGGMRGATHLPTTCAVVTVYQPLLQIWGCHWKQWCPL